jgi:hypothetical protein
MGFTNKKQKLKSPEPVPLSVLLSCNYKQWCCFVIVTLSTSLYLLMVCVAMNNTNCFCCFTVDYAV